MSKNQHSLATGGNAGNTLLPHTACKGVAHGGQLLEAALRYAALGWHVLPVHGIVEGRCTCKPKNSQCSPGKHPLIRYGLHDATTEEDTIRSWWDQCPVANIGIRTGAESDFWVLDVDLPNGPQALATLCQQHGKLPKTRTVRTGGGGMQYYFTYPGCSVPTGTGIRPGLDVRGDGGYVVAPPSCHETKNVYAWLHEVDLAPAPAWLLSLVTQRIRMIQKDTEDSQDYEDSKDSQVIVQAHNENSEDSAKCIDEILRNTQPKAVGQRRAHVFLLARCLKGIPVYNDADLPSLKQLVRKWHDMALPIIGTKPFTETWADFVRGWNNVMFPAGEDPKNKVLEKAKMCIPPEVQDYDCTKAQLLASICRELQRTWRDKPFYLGCRKAGELIGVSYKTASNYLYLFVAEKLLQVVEPGGERETVRRATRYLYLGKIDS